jgi:xanthine dehydrogenase accessory factor
MQKLIPEILDALLRGERVILTTVIESKGSTPRKVGSAMAVFADGTSRGTVGGGAIEYEVQRVAREEMPKDEPPRSFTNGYSLSSDGLGDLCMICGGDVSVHFTAVEPDEWTLMTFERALGEAPEGGAWFAMQMKKDAPTQISLQFKQGGFGPKVPTERLTRRAGFEKENEDYDGLLTIPLTVEGRVYIFGAGHVGRELVPAMSRVGFKCVVFDDRPEYADAAFFPQAERVILGDFKDIGRHISFVPEDYVIVVTRDHKLDYESLRQTLPSAAGYVGAMGSRRKMTIIRQRLAEEAGLDAGVIARLVAPLGIQIGAETPEELAVSLTAELIQVRAGR